MYHRVTDLACDPWSLAVSPRHFREHLEVLNSHGKVLPLQQMVERIANNTLSENTIAVTFDDGYADNYHEAKPLLEEKNIPGTMFAVTDFVGKQREFWWDELERIFLQPGVLPQKLSLNVSGSQMNWDLGEYRVYSEPDYELHRCWATWQPPPTSRQVIYYDVWKTLKSLEEFAREEQMQNLRSWAELPITARSSHRTMSPAELASLKDHPLIEVGCHTATHQRLSALPSWEQSAEIQQSKDYLEKILNQPVETFAYPYGWHGDYTEETVSLVKSSGFKSACSAFQYLVSPGCDIFQLPRFPVQNWNGQDFEKQLAAWNEGS